MKYFVIMQTPNGDLYAKCFDSYVEVADYVKSITSARWGLFQLFGHISNGVSHRVFNHSKFKEEHI